jgi:two-component system alkaline phosphatase synthesis response regulator PhoP
LGIKTRILAIDDETKAIELFKSNLEQYGFEVLTASDGQAGIDIAIAEKPDCIILDIRMPKLDGWDVCKRLKLSSATRSIPIIILTAYSSVRDQERAKILGVNEYLTKPVNPDTIADLIKKLITATSEEITDACRPEQRLVDQ